MRKVIKSVWNIEITSCTCAIKHDSNEDVPEAQPTIDVEDLDVFLVFLEEDDAEILLDYNNLMMISIL